MVFVGELVSSRQNRRRRHFRCFRVERNRRRHCRRRSTHLRSRAATRRTRLRPGRHLQIENPILLLNLLAWPYGECFKGKVTVLFQARQSAQIIIF